MSNEFSRRRRREGGERSEVLRDAALSSPPESGASESRSPPSLTGIIPPSLSLRGFIWCHLEAEVDPLQGKWAVSQTRQMRRDVVRSELLELEGWKLGEKGQRVRLIVGV